MWSDSPDPSRLEQWARQLRGLLPEQCGCGSRVRVGLGSAAGPAQVIEALGLGPGAVWLDGSDEGTQLIALEPLLTVFADAQSGGTFGGSRQLRLPTDGLSVLAAASIAWADSGTRWFGYLGYELGARLEEIPVRCASSDLPDLWLGLHDRWLERRDGRWELVGCTAWTTPARFRAQARRIEGRLRAAPPDRPEPGSSAGPIRSAPGPSEYRAAVARTVRRIHAGEIFQADLCRRFRVPFPKADRLRLYRRLRDRNPAQYGAYLELGDAAILSMSPECFLRVRGCQVESRPIKGTRGRGATAGIDAGLAAELLSSSKDRAELAMIVDLVRNDLGRVCVPGSVGVAAHGRLMRLPTVLHTDSRIVGRLRSGVTAADLIRATFPAGSITGAPKIQAMIVAASEEPYRRGAAMGSIGWIDQGGDLELSVAIRTAVVADGSVVYHAGCGIVADSDPEAELQETEIKARAFLEAVR